MEKSEKKFSFIAVFILVASVVFLSQILSGESRIKILNIFRMPLKIISGSWYALRDFSEFTGMRNENRILKENIANLEKQLLNLQEFRLENQRLKELLGFRDVDQAKFIPAMVIARDPSPLRDTIIIDKGKKHNVHKDMVVISGNGLVGRVRESGWSIARVALITDPDSVVSGIVDRTRDEGAVAGTGRSGLIMKYLELDCEAAKGDKVVTSGFGGVFEKGILIGEVVSVVKDDSRLYMYAIVKPAVDMMRLEEVLVMR